MILAQAKRLSRRTSVGARTVIVVAGDGWHRGVIGIVASKSSMPSTGRRS